MGKLAGKSGYITYGGSRIADMRNIEITVDKNTEDVTTFDSQGWREFLATLREWNVSFDGLFNGKDAAQKAILLDILGDDNDTGVEIVVTLASGITLTGDVIVTNSTIPVAVEGAIEVSYDAQGTGALTPVMPS